MVTIILMASRALAASTAGEAGRRTSPTSPAASTNAFAVSPVRVQRSHGVSDGPAIAVSSGA